ncbi:MAG: RIP metalloprotease RseP [Clostridia bacterium]|nr:RIP metalloprotease RseP [Clostridia bacterium]
MKILYWLLAFLVFSVLIFVHELGHYLTARLFHVKIEEFSIGMGPKMLTYTSKKTGIKYSLGVFFFGGYVSMAGEDEESDDPNALSKKAAWKRFIIVAAGAVMNFLFGAILMFALVLSSGPLGSNRIAEFRPDSFYEQNGFTTASSEVLQAGDEILAVNGHAVHIANDVSYEIMHEGGEEIPVTVLRDGVKMTLSVTFPSVTEGKMSLGVPDFYVEAEKSTPLNLLRHTFFRCTSTVKMVYDGLFDMLGGKYGMEGVSGPIGVADAISTAAETDILQLLYLTVVISINLGVVNLLPLPALDGGRLVFILIEMIFRRPVPQKYEAIVHFVGIILLLGLTVLIAFKDIFTLFS